MVALGHLTQRDNTFWQIVLRAPGAARWRLVTPPGVASNGGFSAETTQGAAGAPGVVTAGFQPSQYLRYSPIASTSDGGKTWAAGTLAAGLLPVADAVAGAPGGAVLALVRAEGGSLEVSKTSLTAWRVLVTRSALGATDAGRSCGVLALSAVAAAPAGSSSPELGAACSAPGVVGLFHLSSRRWVATRVRAPAGAGATLTVLRLVTGPTGTSALVEARRPRGASLLDLWRSGPKARWAATKEVRLRGSVVSTAVLGPRSLVVGTGRGLRVQDLLWTGGPSTAWRSLGAPPAGTQVVALAPGAALPPPGAAPSKDAGPLSALVVSGSEVTVWQRSSTGRWTPTSERLHVPVEYGTST